MRIQLFQGVLCFEPQTDEEMELVDLAYETLKVLSKGSMEFERIFEDGLSDGPFALAEVTSESDVGTDLTDQKAVI